MDCIVTAEDVKNATGIELSKVLGKECQYVNRWLERQQRAILNHIACYAWGGIQQAESFLENPRSRAKIKEALIEHIDFLAHNNFIDASDIADKDVTQRMHNVAPLAHQILLNAGLLYTGAR